MHGGIARYDLLTAHEALRTSTTDPFEQPGERDRARRIAVEGHSDLLLLSGDPLKDISADSRIQGVLIPARSVLRAGTDRV